MNTTHLSYHKFRRWVVNQDSPIAARLYSLAKCFRLIELPNMPALYGLVYRLYLMVKTLLSTFTRIFLWTPMFKSRVLNNPKQLFLYGGIPFVSGPLEIAIGSNCRVSGQTTFSGRAASAIRPRLEVGNNVDIGWQTTIAVGTVVKLGNNCRIAGRAFLAGYPGHPLEARARALGQACRDDQAGPIILENDVWLATGVSVMAGVTIGQGTIVAAGSVVTKDLPPNVLAAGVPAKVIRTIEENQ